MDIFNEGELRDMRASFQPAQWPSASSAQAPVENRGASQLVGSDASGSLPASSVDRLLTKWHAASEGWKDSARGAARENDEELCERCWARAEAIDRMIRQFRAELVRANVRQPEENRALSSTQ